MTSTTLKQQAREYAAQHGVGYQRALHIVTEPAFAKMKAGVDHAGRLSTAPATLLANEPHVLFVGAFAESCAQDLRASLKAQLSGPSDPDVVIVERSFADLIDILAARFRAMLDLGCATLADLRLLERAHDPRLSESDAYQAMMKVEAKLFPGILGSKPGGTRYVVAFVNSLGSGPWSDNIAERWALERIVREGRAGGIHAVVAVPWEHSISGVPTSLRSSMDVRMTFEEPETGLVMDEGPGPAYLAGSALSHDGAVTRLKQPDRLVGYYVQERDGIQTLLRKAYGFSVRAYPDPTNGMWTVEWMAESKCKNCGHLCSEHASNQGRCSRDYDDTLGYSTCNCGALILPDDDPGSRRTGTVVSDVVNAESDPDEIVAWIKGVQLSVSSRTPTAAPLATPVATDPMPEYLRGQRLWAHRVESPVIVRHSSGVVVVRKNDAAPKPSRAMLAVASEVSDLHPALVLHDNILKKGRSSDGVAHFMSAWLLYVSAPGHPGGWRSMRLRPSRIKDLTGCTGDVMALSESAQAAWVDSRIQDGHQRTILFRYLDVEGAYRYDTRAGIALRDIVMKDLDLVEAIEQAVNDGTVSASQIVTTLRDHVIPTLMECDEAHGRTGRLVDRWPDEPSPAPYLMPSYTKHIGRRALTWRLDPKAFLHFAVQ